MLNLSWKKPLSCSWIFAILRQFFSQFVATLSAGTVGQKQVNHQNWQSIYGIRIYKISATLPPTREETVCNLWFRNLLPKNRRVFASFQTQEVSSGPKKFIVSVETSAIPESWRPKFHHFFLAVKNPGDVTRTFVKNHPL